MADFNPKHGPAMAIQFTYTNATTGLSNADLTFAGGATTLVVAPQAGSVIGISANCAAITAGTITLKPHKASVEYADAGTPAPALSSAHNTNGTYATVRPSALTFAAGDTLGISATTTTTLDPTNTLDVDAVLWIQLDPE
jgi:hypothetical protein